MRDSAHIIEIDHIVLTDLGLTPERAVRVRALLEAELQRLLVRGGWPEGMPVGAVDRLEAPTLHLPHSHTDSHLASGLAHTDSHLASGLAQSIAQAVRGLGGGMPAATPHPQVSASQKTLSGE
jgi:hypothetical protein